MKIRKTKRPRNNRRRTPFRWAGGKAMLMPKLIPLMPNHHKYVSVFGGSGADIYVKPKSKSEIYNDLNSDIVNVYRVLRSEKERKELCFRLRYTPKSRLQFERCTLLLRSDERCPVMRAWAFFYSSFFVFGGIDPTCCRSGQFAARDLCSQVAVTKHIESVSRRFWNVLLENRTWQQIIEKYDHEDTFFYFDPPYEPTTLSSSKLYKHEMSSVEHEELLTVLQGLSGKAMISGYASSLYDEFLTNWRRVSFSTTCAMSSQAKRPPRTEVVWMNYDELGNKLV